MENEERQNVLGIYNINIYLKLVKYNNQEIDSISIYVLADYLQFF